MCQLQNTVSETYSYENSKFHQNDGYFLVINDQTDTRIYLIFIVRSVELCIYCSRAVLNMRLVKLFLNMKVHTLKPKFFCDLKLTHILYIFFLYISTETIHVPCHYRHSVKIPRPQLYYYLEF